MSEELVAKYGAPPKLAKNAVRIVQLGGLGNVGRNMAVFEHDGKLLVLDCGVLFPGEHQPGVDLILPDFNYLECRYDQISAIVLTHGHEDHIGAVPYLLRKRPDIPLIGTQLTLALVEAKLQEHRIKPFTHAIREGDVERLGPFECEFIAVNHSIPDAVAVAITTPAGRILHTGDFRLDQLPLDNRLTDLRAFGRIGEAGVDLFMTDSTNAEVPGFHKPEREIGPVLEGVIAKSRRRVVVASFSSHVHRVQQVLDAAAKHNRKVAFVGRSMVRNMRIATDLGYLKVPDNIVVDIRKIADYNPHQVVLMCTGSQGEAMAALSRMANGDHKVKLAEGDTVILASSVIPGNELSISTLINSLIGCGAHVVHKGNAAVHTSGHASAGELLMCYNIVKPKNVMPVHGEPRQLQANGNIAHSSGVPRGRIVEALDGVVVDVRDGLAAVVGAVPCGYVYVDGKSVGQLTDGDLEDRVVLGEEGFINIVCGVNFKTSTIEYGPVIKTRGFAEEDTVFDEIIPKIVDALNAELVKGSDDTHTLQQSMRRVLGRWVGTKLRRRPMLVPLVLEMSS